MLKKGTVVFNKEQLDRILENAPELSNSIEKYAVITHIMENPDILPPKVSDAEYQQVRKNVTKLKQELTLDIPFPKAQKTNFKFIDLFAGIGGFRQAMQNQGGNCVFSSEWDKDAAKTYFANYGVYPFGDIREIDASSIPDHDVLCAGFPCQPFSIAGVSKKRSMGRKTGFGDKAQGTLFFEIARILEEKRPMFFFLENVKNILSHDGNETIKIIKETFKSLNYEFLIEVVDGKAWVPQHRERVFFLGYDKTKFKDELDGFHIPKGPSTGYVYTTLDKIIDVSSTERTLSDGTWRALQRHKDAHAKKNNGFGYSILKLPITADQITWTISARYHKDGADCLVPQEERNPRQLSLKEILQLQGFDANKFKFPGGIVQSYKQIGNSVVIPAIEETAKVISKIILEQRE